MSKVATLQPIRKLNFPFSQKSCNLNITYFIGSLCIIYDVSSRSFLPSALQILIPTIPSPNLETSNSFRNFSFKNSLIFIMVMDLGKPCTTTSNWSMLSADVDRIVTDPTYMRNLRIYQWLVTFARANRSTSYPNKYWFSKSIFKATPQLFSCLVMPQDFVTQDVAHFVITYIDEDNDCRVVTK